MSDRKKQIEEAAKILVRTPNMGFESCFRKGAEWADKNPAPTQSGDDERDVMFTQKDEDDAQNAAIKYVGGEQFAYGPAFQRYRDGFLDGRRGMVSASEVERCRHLEKRYGCEGMVHASEVEKAVKAERERIGFAILPLLEQATEIDFNESNYDAGWVQALVAVRMLLNPTPTGESGEGV